MSRSNDEQRIRDRDVVTEGGLRGAELCSTLKVKMAVSQSEA